MTNYNCNFISVSNKNIFNFTGFDFKGFVESDIDNHSVIHTSGSEDEIFDDDDNDDKYVFELGKRK